MTTDALLTAIQDRIEATILNLDRVHLIEGTPLGYLLLIQKGVSAFVGYRGEVPQSRTAGSTTHTRAVRVAVSVMQTHSGRSAAPAEVKIANDAMDAVVTAIEHTTGSPRWWTAINGICGVQLTEIQAISTETGDFTGRDILFTFVTEANA